jgi:hypothetical protein
VSHLRSFRQAHEAATTPWRKDLYVPCSRDSEALILIDVAIRIFRASCAGGSLALAALYLWCPVHRFPAAQPFHGARWYNPYAGVPAGTPWRKVNLHAHSRVWLGLTNGRGSADDVARQYHALGYDVAAPSNYQEVSRSTALETSALTVYEQGFNASKVHFLALSPRRVDWLDYPLLQGRDEEQHRIDRLRASSALVILAHPELRHAIADDDFRALTGYTAMEVWSNHSRGERAWNIALDAGRPVWGVANDDTHDVRSPNETGRYWTMIASAGTDGPSLERALAAGRAYAVLGRHGHAELSLRSFVLTGDTLAVAFAGPPAKLQLIGPGGRVLAQMTAADSARWVIPCDAPWVRVVARTRTSIVSLEPLLRSDSGALPHLEATVAPVPTLARRGLAVVLGMLGILACLSPSTSARTRRESLGADDALRPAA